MDSSDLYFHNYNRSNSPYFSEDIIEVSKKIGNKSITEYARCIGTYSKLKLKNIIYELSIRLRIKLKSASKEIS